MTDKKAAKKTSAKKVAAKRTANIDEMPARIVFDDAAAERTAEAMASGLVDTLEEAKDAALQSTRRPAPAVWVPRAVRAGNQAANRSYRELNVMLKDLGYLKGDITSRYGTNTRNGVSLLQQALMRNKSYKGAPHGHFDEATRAALLADPKFATTEDATNTP
jgi:peptidoglycan hydrolase-like protein with peptidoglycan-binding domain